MLRPVVVLALCLFALRASAQGPNAARSIEELRAQINAHVTEPRFNGAHWSIKIASLDTGDTVFEHHADRLMSPASNSKLYAGALALDHFGGDYRINTSLYATAKPNRAGKIRGDVIILGRGDPSWRPDPDTTNFWALFDPFVSLLTNAGVRRVTGDIVADATFFRGPPSGASWTVDDMEDYYGAEISAITLVDNLVELRVTPGAEAGHPCALELLQPQTGITLHNHMTTVARGGSTHIEVHRIVGETSVHVIGEMPVGAAAEIEDVPVPHPATWFASAFKEALARSGIRVKGDARSVSWPEPSPVQPDAILLGEIASPPLRDLVSAFMKRSQNLETDLVFNHVGETTRSNKTRSWRTSEQLAVQALEAFLRTNGLPVDDLRFDEGSGLSRNNLTSAALTLELLTFMAAHPASNDFLNSLSVAGVDGTLRRRMKGTPAEGNMRGKTGTLRWVNALSGYVTSAAGEPLVFSLMLNRNVAVPGRSGGMELNDIAVMLARFLSHSETTLESLYAPQGRLILAQFATAPFPHPSRIEGHVYRGQRFSAADHYSDSTVAIFVPEGFRETEAVDFVVHFHGWNNSVAKTLAHTRLIEQWVASSKNAILVVPSGPLNASDSSGGKLEDPDGFKRFMREVMRTLEAKGVTADGSTGIGDIILSGHSGGYRVMAAILERGGLEAQVGEVWLFDALYGGADTFLEWQTNQNGRLIIVYTDTGGTLAKTQESMEELEKRGVTYHAAEDVHLAASELGTDRVILIHSDLAHGEVVVKGELFKQLLETSGLEQE